MDVEVGRRALERERFEGEAARGAVIRSRSRGDAREARVLVEEVPGQVGWYRCNLRVVPHLKYEGASFELSLVGKLDKD